MRRWEKRARRWDVNAEQRRLRRKSGRDEVLTATYRAYGSPSQHENGVPEAPAANMNQEGTEPDATLAAYS